METPRRILVVKMSAIGDVVHATPAARALREAFPDAHVTWIVDRVCAAVVEGNPYLSQVLVVEKRAGLFARAAGCYRCVRSLPPFDWTIDLQGLARSGLVTLASRARMRAGFSSAREGSRHVYNRVVEGPLPDRHRVDAYASLLEALGVPVPHREMLVPVCPEHEAEVDALPAAEAPGCGPLVVTCITAGRPQKCWPPERYAAVADRLIAAHGCRVAVVGAAGDRAPVDAMKSAMRERPIDLVGRLTLKSLAALIGRADLFLSADTGPLHIASAMRTPCVALFGPTDPTLFGPYRVEDITIRKHCRCAPRWRHPVCQDTECIRAITVEEVEEAVVEMLARTTAARRGA